ncbi:MAG TPA: tetratricopeptide repeat protein [Thermoleophilaceae bacterium]|jgi:tetratricopeptide (TPR) repeat protein
MRTDADNSALRMAEYYLEINRPEEALHALDSSGVALEEPGAWLIRGTALFALERHDEAGKAAEEGLREDPDDVWLLHLLSIAKEALGDLAASERAILAALELEPDIPGLYTQYADLLMRAGQLDKAHAVIERAAALDPEDLSVLRARMSYAYVTGKAREGEKWSRKMLELEPEHPGAHGMLGVFKIEQGSVIGAREHYETAVALDPSSPDAREATIEIRTATHPAMLPARALDRLGVAGSWVAAVIVITALRSVSPGAGAVAGITWVTFCVYTWVAPPIVRRLVIRKLS